MSKSPIVIVGCGGFGREVHDVIDAINRKSPSWEVVGYVDDEPKPTNRHLVERRGSRLLGQVDWLAREGNDVQYIIGIGASSIRATIDRRLAAIGLTSPVLIHPAATLGHDVQIDPGTIICAGVRVTTNISLGRHVHLHVNTTVGHDCNLRDYVTVHPLVAISGAVVIGREAMIGTKSAILPGLTIGPNAVVGACACVVRDVADGTTVKGVPAR
jgi:sugar O-acyltransferase (sialic acid O-acetyltransferase NeuD family)